MTTYIWPYHRLSRSAKALAEAMKVKRYDTRKYEGEELETVINWGSQSSIIKAKTLLNKPSCVKVCSDKVKFFSAVKDKVRIPAYTESLEEALEFIKKGETVLGRKRRGYGGTDIVFYEDDPDVFAMSDFFSVYKKKKDEYRVHVIGDKIILVQKKSLRLTDDEGNPVNKDDIDFRIRNHANGFIFKRNDIDPPKDVLDQAFAAVKAVGLDFGAVDVIYNNYERQAYVLEVNTAPGLEGTTVFDYAKAMNELIGERNT